MATQGKVKSALASKYKNADAAIKAHAKDQTRMGIINLPGGIQNGIAQVSKCYFAQVQDNSEWKKADGSPAKGEYYFRAEGTVNSPEKVATPDGVIPIKGLTTSIVIPFFDTKNDKGEVSSQEYHIDRILNEMRKLMGDEYTADASIEELEALAQGIEETAPYFWFSTSQSKPSEKYPNPRVFENWNGGKGLEDYNPAEPPAMKDGGSPSTNGQPKGNTQQQEVKKEEEEEESLDDLVALADSDTDSAEVAQQKLHDLAIEAGYTEEEVSAEDVTWEMVKEMIENPRSPDEAKTDDEDDTKKDEEVAKAPKKGGTYKYTPEGKDAKGKPYKERDCQVVSVNERKETAVLKDLGTKKEYKDVEWSELK